MKPENKGNFSFDSNRNLPIGEDKLEFIYILYYHGNIKSYLHRFGITEQPTFECITKKSIDINIFKRRETN